MTSDNQPTREQKRITHKKRRLVLSVIFAVIIVCAGAFAVYVNDYYRADEIAVQAMAASYAANHAEELDGLVLLAAYSTKDLTQSGLDVRSIYGSEDGVLNKEKYDTSRGNLPSDTVEFVIDGGCHAGFGYYGPQTGDSEPRISAQEQIGQTADEIVQMAAE